MPRYVARKQPCDSRMILQVSGAERLVRVSDAQPSVSVNVLHQPITDCYWAGAVEACRCDFCLAATRTVPESQVPAYGVHDAHHMCRMAMSRDAAPDIVDKHTLTRSQAAGQVKDDEASGVVVGARHHLFPGGLSRALQLQ